MLKKYFLIGLVWLGSAEAIASDLIRVPRFFVELSEQTDVPADILYALAVKETNTKMNNRSVAPWPFTLNVRFKGYRYGTYEDMMRAAQQFIASGTRSVDIGLFQVNWRWNGHRAKSLEHLGLPHENGRVAAEILREYYDRHGSWVKAAGLYHNPANKDGRADSYAKEYEEILKLIQSGEYQKNIKIGNSVQRS